MPKLETSYERLVEKFVRWAEAISDIRAAIVVGSRARSDHPANEWADLDIMIVTSDPKRYISTSHWTRNIGNPLLTFLEPTAAGDGMERRVLFEGMLDVDFAVFAEEEFKRTAQQFQRGEIPPQMAAQILEVFSRGMRVLLDKDGMIAKLQALLDSLEPPPSRPPTQQQFIEAVNDFLYHAVFTAKHLRRGELWWTVTCLNCYMQRLMCRMMEWHAKATYGSNHDTWFRGRFLEEWANPQALKGLQNCFAHYDEEDIERALLAAMDLFRLMAIEVAEKLGYPYPTEADGQVRRWIDRTMQGRRR